MPQAYHKAAANVLQHMANMLFRSMQRTRATQASREPDSIAHAVLMDKTMRANYDRTGQIPDDKAKNAANQQSTGEEEDFGFEQRGPSTPPGGHHGRSGRWHHFESYDAFEVRLAQGRARRARSMEQLRRHLFAPNGTAIRFGLVGFYRAGEEATLKEHLKFPYPFAGWSLGREGSGFWWEVSGPPAREAWPDLAGPS